MNLDDYFYLGHFAKTYGIKGELILFLDVDNSSDYTELDSFFMHDHGTLLPYFIEKLSEHGKSRFRIKLEEVENIEEAEKILKKDIYLPLSALPNLGDKQFYYHEIAGYQVKTSEQDLGVITGVMELPSNPLLQVDYDGQEILLPISDETIVHVDREKKVLTVNTPEGLLDLYLEEHTPEDED